MPSAIPIRGSSKLLSTRKLVPITVLFILLSVGSLWAGLRNIRFVGFDLTLGAFAFLSFISIVYSQFRPNRRLAEMSYHASLWVLIVPVSALFPYLAATLNLPLYDEEFAAADKALGFYWIAYYRFFAGHKNIGHMLMAAYYSLLPQVAFSIVFFSHTRRYVRNEELFWMMLVSLSITCALSAMLPAAGTFYYFGMQLSQAVHLHDYFALRTGSFPTLMLSKVEGIVTFPSFHTVAAILLTVVYRGTAVFLLSLLLNTLMLVSTPIFGGHYLVDMLGGAIVAGVSILATRRMLHACKEAPNLYSPERKEVERCSP